MFKALGIADPIIIAFGCEPAGRGKGVEEELLVDCTSTAFVWVIGKIAANGSGHKARLKGKGPRLPGSLIATG